MSMLGISFLNEIVIKDNTLQSNEILNKLRKRVKTTLKQEGKFDETKDGMDISLVVIDTKFKKIQFAGAHNQLFFMQNEEIQSYKGDRMPIGIYFKEKESFTNHEFTYNSGDSIYLFSDGYPDQFRGNDKQRFGLNRFKKLLLSINNLPMNEQHKQISYTIERWMVDSVQIDDMVILGLRL